MTTPFKTDSISYTTGGIWSSDNKKDNVGIGTFVDGEADPDNYLLISHGSNNPFLNSNASFTVKVITAGYSGTFVPGFYTAAKVNANQVTLPSGAFVGGYEDGVHFTTKYSIGETVDSVAISSGYGVVWYYVIYHNAAGTPVRMGRLMACWNPLDAASLAVEPTPVEFGSSMSNVHLKVEEVGPNVELLAFIDDNAITYHIKLHKIIL